MINYNGLSSLLFIISATKSILISKLLFWKISNTILIFSSYLCNAYGDKYLFFDFFTIYLTTSCYINNLYINSLLNLLLFYEYKKTKQIENIKNISLALALTKTLMITKNNYIILLTSSIIGVNLYTIRYYLFYKNIIYFIKILLNIIY
jgi:hypothetical protein